MISIYKSNICQNFVVIRLQVLIANLQTFQSFPLSRLNFGVNIFIFSSLMTFNILYKTYLKSKKKIKFSLSNCCNKRHALFLSTTVHIKFQLITARFVHFASIANQLDRCHRCYDTTIALHAQRFPSSPRYPARPILATQDSTWF
jgi:heme/copper-type cytochrome/quinol oxidase subunit 3